MAQDRTVRIVLTGSPEGAIAALKAVGDTSETMAARIEGHAGRIGGVFSRLSSAAASFGVPFAGALGGVGSKLDDTHAKGKTFTDGMAALGKASLLGGAVGLAAAGAESVKLAGNFQSSMTLIKTQAHDTTDNLADLSKGVLALAGPTATAPNTLAAGLYHVTSTGLRGAQAMDTLKVAAEGAKIGHADLEDTTTALAGAVSSGIPGVQSMSQAMGALNAIVGAGDMRMQDLNEALGTGVLAVVRGFGLSLNDAGAALATFGDNNIRGADAATNLKMAVQAMAKPLAQAGGDSKALASAQKGVETAHRGVASAALALKAVQDRQRTDRNARQVISDRDAETAAEVRLAQAKQNAVDAQAKLDAAAAGPAGGKGLAAIGMSAGQLAKDMQTGGLNKALTDLKTHMDAAGITGSKVGEFILQTFGKKQATGLTVLLDNFDKFQSKIGEVTSGGKSFGKDWATTTHNLNFQIDQLKASSEALGVKFGDFLIPKLEAVLGFFQKHKKAAEVLAGVIAGVLGAAVVTFAVERAVRFGQAVGKMADGVGTLITKLTGSGGLKDAAGSALSEADTAGQQIAAGAGKAETGLATAGTAAGGQLEAGAGTAGAELRTGAGAAAGELEAGGATAETEVVAGGTTAEAALATGGVSAAGKLVAGATQILGVLAAGFAAYQGMTELLKHTPLGGAEKDVLHFFGIGGDNVTKAGIAKNIVGGQSTLDQLAKTDPRAAAILKGLPSYDTGGMVPGPPGRPMLAVVHGGEYVVPNSRTGGSPWSGGSSQPTRPHQQIIINAQTNASASDMATEIGFELLLAR